MFIVVLAQVSAACGPVDPGSAPLNAPSAGHGVFFEGGTVLAREDFTFSVNGAEATGELHTWTDPDSGVSYALFLPDPALVEGEEYHIVTVDADGGDVVSDGVVAPEAAAVIPTVTAVTLGEIVEGSGADCLDAGVKYRPVEVEVSAGTGLLVLTGQGSNEVVKVGYVDGTATTLSFYREGTGADFPCIEPTTVRADGGEVAVAAVCSDQGNLCDCSSTGGAAVGWLAGALVFALRRGRR